MTRLFAALIGATLIASPAAARTYSAQLAAAASNDRIITRNIVWSCGGDSCRGATEASRPLVLCQSLAREAGRVESFTADGQALDAADLERCNASAKESQSSKLADAR